MRPPRAPTRAEREAAAQAAPVRLSEPPPPMPAPAVQGPAGWDGILQPGEQILWRGQPIRRIRWGKLVAGVVFALGFCGIGGALSLAAAREGSLFWLVGLVLCLLGIAALVVTLLDERMRRNDTFFTLSDRAAYIARRHWAKGRVLESWPIRAGMEIALQGGDKAGDVIFASRTTGRGKEAEIEPVGFFDIIGAPEVFALLKHARDARE
ncbi:hypothetical protein [Rhodobacter lacus]|uniref:Aspartate carbamoyltransferase catalytic subunit n=1 Tax=Rhodobacter lacus TaxID=1641972 RepID=A0ABW5A4D3_9RHOB